MAQFKVEFTSSVLRQLDKLPSKISHKLVAAAESLGDTPYPIGTKKMQGGQDLWRIRVGDYRIIYRVERHRLVVLILRIGHRREVYR
ncbi:MAG TPA: type II toxin-antitoxin system RelE/ParE family toxin [Terriglobales bacterium]|nr:type II toxin-antitoxin system RelE/ParE family toxin [Terriglobales bacterium]